MSGLVFIDDENNDVIDAWMKDTSAGFVKGSSVESSEPVTSKGGLGFVASSSGAKQKDGANKKNVDKLASKKRGFQNSFEDDEMHGVVDDIDESRTAIKSDKDKKLDAEKKKAEIEQAKQAKKLKVEKPNTFSGPPSQQHNKPASQPPQQQKGGKDGKNTQNVNNNKNNNSNKSQPSNANSNVKPAPKAATAAQSSTEGATSTTTGTDASADTAEKRENSRIRKRTKTRSKQKNIRRDNRADALKPAHLQAGSKEFHGRPLTDATKVVLGLAPK